MARAGRHALASARCSAPAAGVLFIPGPMAGVVIAAFEMAVICAVEVVFILCFGIGFGPEFVQFIEVGLGFRCLSRAVGRCRGVIGLVFHVPVGFFRARILAVFVGTAWWHDA